MTFYFRHFVILFLASWILNGCSVVNSLRMMKANENLSPVWSTDNTQQILEAIYIGEKPYIKVVGNDSTELLFLIDTGASFSMLFDTPNVEGLTKKRGFDLAVGGWGEGEDSKAYQSELSSLQIADARFEGVNVAYIPLSTTPYYAREDEAIFDGVLGHDLMQHFVWTFDKSGGQIKMATEAPEVLEGDIVLPISIFLSKLSVPASVKFNNSYEVERDLLIDTGSRHYLKLSAAYPHENAISLGGTSVTAADFGLSGVTEHQRVTLPGVGFNTLFLSNVKTNLIPSDDEDDWWVLGSALMNQFITVIDYHNKRFIIRPYPKTEYVSHYNLAGIELRKLQNGHFVVRYVSSELPASMAGLKAGDEVVRIDEVDAKQISEEQWTEINAEPKTTKMCLKSGHCVTFVTEHIDGYSTLKAWQ